MALKNLSKSFNNDELEYFKNNLNNYTKQIVYRKFISQNESLPKDNKNPYIDDLIDYANKEVIKKKKKTYH